MALKTVKAPKEIEPVFVRAEEIVKKFFSARRDDPSKGTIEISGQRYVLIRAAALSIEFFAFVKGLFGEGREAEAEEFAQNILFDLSHAIGKSDAHSIQASMNLTDPIERLAIGPVHFSYSGWAFVDISPDSHISPDENFCLVYDHPYSFEADAWIHEHRKPDFPACIMNAGYSSGWCEESFGVGLVASEILCRAKGDDCCRFVMAPPSRIEKHIERYVKSIPRATKVIHPYTVPGFFERKRAEEELRKSEAKYHSLANSLPQTVFEIDREGNITFVNEGALEMFGYTPEDLQAGLNAFQMIHPDERQRVKENMDRLLTERLKNKAAEYTALRKDGSTFPISIYSSAIVREGEAVGLRGIAADITERKRAEEAAVLAQQYWTRTFDAVPDLVMIIDNEKRIVRANKAMTERLGLQPGQCAGQLCHACVHGLDAPPSFCPHAQLLKDGKEHAAEIQDERLGGIFMVRVFPIFDEEGNVEGAVHVAQDITKEKQAEEARRIKDRLIASSVNPIVMADLEGNLTYVNHAFLASWGCSSEKQALGKPGARFWQMSADASESLEEEGKWIGKVSGRKVDGSSLDLQLSATVVRDEADKPICMAFSFVNITEELQLRRRLKAEHSFAGLIGRDAIMLDIFDTIREVAEVTVPVLIQGESGTGKELVAAAIHTEGPRAGKPFIAVNCGALPEGLLASELFGHVQGAFTGAVRDRKGRFELADGGSIFLDEISDISLGMQVNLLRVLQDGTFERIGDENTRTVDVRVISATNKDLRQEVAAGRFREDLFYRLSVVPVSLPPLRKRKNDIPLLVEHLLKKAQSSEVGQETVVLSQQAIETLMDYHWPGNVRELENALQYALVKCRGSVLEARHLPPTVRQERTLESQRKPRRRKHKFDAQAVRNALDKTGGKKTEAARILGVSRATLYRFLASAEMSNQDIR